MSRAHIENMKKAVSGYYSAVGEASDRISKNNSMYREDIAEAENKKVLSGLRDKRSAAEDAIIKAQDAGMMEAASWGRLDGAKITDDAKLLQMELSPEQFNELKERYKGNGTMSAMLVQYAHQHNAAKQADDPSAIMRFNVLDIPTTESKQKAYSAFANGALHLLDRMDSNDGFLSGTNSEMLKAAVETFGEPTQMNAQLFELID